MISNCCHVVGIFTPASVRCNICLQWERNSTTMTYPQRIFLSVQMQFCCWPRHFSSWHPRSVPHLASDWFVTFTKHASASDREKRIEQSNYFSRGRETRCVSNSNSRSSARHPVDGLFFLSFSLSLILSP